MENNHWANLTDDQLAMGYIIPHIAKRALDNDGKGMTLLIQAYVGVVASPTHVADQTSDMRKYARKMSDDGFYTTAFVLEECARRIDAACAPIQPEKIWIYPVDDGDGWVTHEHGDSFPSDAHQSREDAVAAAQAQYPGVPVVEAVPPLWGHSPQHETIKS